MVGKVDIIKFSIPNIHFNFQDAWCGFMEVFNFGFYLLYIHNDFFQGNDDKILT